MRASLKILSVIILLGAVAWWSAPHWMPYLPKSVSEKNDAIIPDKIFKTKRGSLTLGVVLSGNVNASKKYKLGLTVPFNTTLISVVAENSKVKEGDELAVFESRPIDVKIEELSLSLENADADLAIAKEQLRILEKTNNAALKGAQHDVVEAEDTLNKYLKLEGPKEKDAQLQQVEAALKEMNEAKTEYSDACDDLNSTVFIKQSDEDKARQKADDAQRVLDSQKSK